MFQIAGCACPYACTYTKHINHTEATYVTFSSLCIDLRGRRYLGSLAYAVLYVVRAFSRLHKTSVYVPPPLSCLPPRTPTTSGVGGTYNRALQSWGKTQTMQTQPLLINRIASPFIFIIVVFPFPSTLPLQLSTYI